MDFEDFYSKIQRQLDEQLPFVVYRKPDSDIVHSFFQPDNTLYKVQDYSETGFVFAPFDLGSETILIPFSAENYHSLNISEHTFSRISTIDNDRFINEENSEDTRSKEREKHLGLVKNGIKEILSGRFQKVVLSRLEKLVFAKPHNPVEIFQKLVDSYPTAFVYLWYHPKLGIWLGATPETLLHISKNQLHTMALAGTLPHYEGKPVNWGEKEIEEQEIVTQYIVQQLSVVSEDIISSKTYTHRAGELLHLRTDIKASIENINSKMRHIIKLLHPTPAVCGLPKEDAALFIQKKEGYNRKFYTGFLGELNMSSNQKTESDLFVNLRCMEIKDNQAFIYVGGGITKDSDPEQEWEETVRKTLTMKKVLM